MYISLTAIHRIIITLATIAAIIVVHHYRGLDVVSSKIFYNHVAVIVFIIGAVITSSIYIGDERAKRGSKEI